MAKKTLKLKPFFNKRNGQINFNLGMKTLPESLKKIVRKQPKNMKFKFKFEGIEL